MIEIYADASRGIYIPEFFAETCNLEEWVGITQKDLNDLTLENQFYWEAWDIILNKARTKDGRRLYHDGDLFIGNDEEIEALLIGDI